MSEDRYVTIVIAEQQRLKLLTALNARIDAVRQMRTARLNRGTSIMGLDEQERDLREVRDIVRGAPTKTTRELAAEMAHHIFGTFSDVNAAGADRFSAELDARRRDLEQRFGGKAA